jgi:phosphatidylserine/phosphatidylglycerophosphate/cardiolipin synthase-like enzyme
MPLVDLQLIRDRAHYEVLVAGAMAGARVSVWIASANVKELMIEAPRGTRARARDRYVPIFDLFDRLHERGVELRLLHAGVPSGPFREELKRHRALATGALAMRRCPRVHLKMIAIDGALLYLGSANLTGAGLGAKGDHRRNFEAGVVTADERFLDEMQGVYERIWSGAECAPCRLRDVCPRPLDIPVTKPVKPATTR